MAIKKLQQNFTTIEQSNRLLELGLPADSADCFMRTDSCVFSPSFLPTANSSIICKKDVLYTDFCASLKICDISCIPIWSVGRLIEIYLLCRAYNFKYEFLADEKPIDTIVSSIEYAIQEHDFDFSKLED